MSVASDKHVSRQLRLTACLCLHAISCSRQCICHNTIACLHLVLTAAYGLNQSGNGPYHSKYLKPDFVSIMQNLNSYFSPIRPLSLVHLRSAAYLLYTVAAIDHSRA